MYDTKLEEVIKNFKFEGEIQSCEPYGNGHINDTYRVISSEGDYILQRINHEVFKNPEALMENVYHVTEFVRDINIAEEKDANREGLTLIRTRSGKYFYRDSIGLYWRAYIFIDNTFSYDLVENVEDFYASALAFGNFQYQLQAFPVEKLHYTIPKFHHTPSRYENLIQAIDNDSQGRVALAQTEIQFAKDREAFTHTLWDLKEQGKLNLKVTHNDTKLNNVLIDQETGKGLCVIDLDTVMPGFALDDFGDSIRFGATTGAEDEKDLSKVNFSMELYKAYVEGFVKGSKGTLTDVEIMHFPEGAKMMTLECGMRFLTDYLEGDTYFKTKYDDHNLVRTRTQFKLVADMEQQWDNMKEISVNIIKDRSF